MIANKDDSSLIELQCEKVQDKLISVRANEVTSVQIYEKSSVPEEVKDRDFH